MGAQGEKGAFPSAGSYPMQLRALRLRNIRSYEGVEVEFGPGTTLLVGDVGAGKTSLLYAIETALFGPAEVDPVNLVRHGAREAEVALVLADEEHRYEFRRRLARKTRGGEEKFESKEGSFSMDGAVRKYSTTELRQRAIDLLGFPDNPDPRSSSDVWRWAVYIPQEQMREVFDQKPAARRQTVRKALGLEQYSIASENAGRLAKELRGQARELEGRATMLAHHEEELAGFVAKLDASRIELHRVQEDSATARTEEAAAEAGQRSAEEALQRLAVDRNTERQLREELTGVHGRTERARTHLGELQRRIVSESDEIRRLSDLLAGRPALAPRLSDARSLVQQLEAEEAGRDGADRARRAATDAFDQATAVAERAAQEALRLGRELAEAEKRRAAVDGESPSTPPIPPTRGTSDQIEQRRTDAARRLEAAQAAVGRSRHVVADLDSLLSSGSCPRCGQAVDPSTFGAHRSEAERELAGSEAGVGVARAEMEAAEQDRQELARYDRDHQTWVQLEARREDARRVAEEARRRMERAEAANREAGDRRRAAQSALDSLPAPGEPGAALRARLAEARAVLTGLEQEAESLARVDQQLEGARRALLEIEADGRRTERELTDLLEARRGLEARLAEVRTRLTGPDLEAAHLEARIRLRAARERVEILGRSAVRLETETVTLAGRIAEAKAALARKTTILTGASAKRELAEFLQGAFREALMGLEERLLRRAQHDFERSFTRTFLALVEDPTMAARIDASFSPVVEIDGEWTPPEALSGGERTALAFAFRIALGEVVRGAGRLRLQTLILDEPTDGFSSEQVGRVGELLRELGVPQVLLVSHESGLTAVADSVLRIGKVRGVSEVRSEAGGASAPDLPMPGPPAP